MRKEILIKINCLLPRLQDLTMYIWNKEKDWVPWICSNRPNVDYVVWVNGKNTIMSIFGIAYERSKIETH